jgi:hypothetical protein
MYPLSGQSSVIEHVGSMIALEFSVAQDIARTYPKHGGREAEDQGLFSHSHSSPRDQRGTRTESVADLLRRSEARSSVIQKTVVGKSLGIDWP